MVWRDPGNLVVIKLAGIIAAHSCGALLPLTRDNGHSLGVTSLGAMIDTTQVHCPDNVGMVRNIFLS